MKNIDDNIFLKFKKLFPFSCIDIILIEKNRFLLVRRAIPPYKNRLCLPGGIVKKNERLEQAVSRIAKTELGINVEIVKPVGFYEKIYRNRHDITHCYIVKKISKQIQLDNQASEFGMYKTIPKETAGFFKIMLNDAGFS